MEKLKSHRKFKFFSNQDLRTKQFPSSNKTAQFQFPTSLDPAGPKFHIYRNTHFFTNTEWESLQTSKGLMQIMSTEFSVRLML